MADVRAQPCPVRFRLNASVKPTAPPQFLLVELKHGILGALSKLADRDTQQIAIEELDKIVETIPPDCASVFLSCLYESDIQQKSVVKKECIRLFGTLASLHGHHLAPHLPKVIASIMRRLRDPDTSVRDACIDTIGILSAEFLSANGRGTIQEASAATLTTFIKPLFDALSEQNKGVQTGAALCLARLIENAKGPPLSAMQRLSLRISKFLSNHNFLARAALLPIFGSLSQVGAVSQQHLAVLMPSMKEALESNNWTIRKAAAETLGRLGSNLGPILMNFKDFILLVLESCRFDKVKPVRDSIQDTIQVWKNLPGAETEGSHAGLSLETPGTEDNNLSSTIGNLNLECPSPILRETASVTEVTKTSQRIADVNYNQKFRQMSEKCAQSKKKIPNLTDRKPNLEFFQKLETRNSCDWGIEVAVPRKRPPSVSASHVNEYQCINDREVQEFLPCNMQKEMKSVNMSEESAVSKDDMMYNHHGQISERQVRESDGNSEIGDVRVNNLVLDENAVVSKFANHNLKAQQSEASSWSDAFLQQHAKDNLSWDAVGCTTSPGSSRSHGEGQDRICRGGENQLLVQSQLFQLENQQSDLLELLQEFMSGSQETILALEARVRGLEKVVEKLTIAGHYGGRVKVSSSDHLDCLKSVHHKVGKSVDVHSSLAGKLATSNAAFSEAKARVDYTWRGSSKLVAEDLDTHDNRKSSYLGNFTDGQVGSRKGNASTFADWQASKDDIGVEQMLNRRGWDRLARPARLGEGPSARSVWQASKDEATLAAIRVVAEDAGAMEAEAPSSKVSGLINPNTAFESMPHKSEGQEKRQLWSLWSCAMDYVRAGDVDSAYVEVLCSADELMLVRLMSKTGPVLEQLSADTTTEVLHAVGPLLQQQSFFDFVIPWVQQAADMVVDNGPEILGISLDAKEELLLSLQVALNMDMPEGWVGNTTDELLEQLANAWSVDLVHNDHER